MDLTGRTLDGRYRVERELSRSHVSSLWVARDTEDEVDVRVRVPAPGLADAPGFATAAAKELRARAGRRTPHQHPVLAAGFDEDLPFAVLKAPDGGSLAERIGDGPAGVELVAGWLPSVAAALDRMHDRGVVHRDVSVDTVSFGPGDEPWLVDDGLSVALAGAAPDHMPPAKTPGELGDLPPEVLERRIGPAYDQYGLAATVFRCLAGRALQPSDSYLGVGQAIEGRLAAPAVDILERALSVVPDDRFSSCGAFAAAFLDAAGVEIQGMDETGTLMMEVKDILGKPGREETGEIPVAAPLPADEEISRPVAAASVAEPTRPPPARPAPAKPSPPPGKGGGAKKALVAIALLVLLAGGAAAFVILGTDRGESADPDAPPGPARAGTHPPATPPDEPPPVETTPEPPPPPPEPVEPMPGPVEPTPEPVEPTPEPVEPTPEPVEPMPGPVEPTPEPVEPTPEPVEPTPEPEPAPAPLPVLRLTAPADGALVAAGPVTVRGRLEGGPAAAVRVAGVRVLPSADGAFSAEVPLDSGENPIEIVPIAADGRSGEAVTVLVVSDRAPPSLTVDSPAPTREDAVTIHGRTTDAHPGAVRVAGRELRPDANGRFEATVDVPPGKSTFEVVAEDAVGNRSAETVSVFRDSTPPRVRLLSPADGATTDADIATVRVAVEDDSPVSVRIGGRDAARGEAGAWRAELPLAMGGNAIPVVATDRLGNTSDALVVHVTREDRAVSITLAPAPARYVTSATVVVTGSLDRPGASVTVGGVPATVNGTSFRGEAPLEPGARGVPVRAELPGGPSATATLEVTRIARDEPVSGPGTVRTAAGETLELGEGAALVLRKPTKEGAEVLALTKGGLSGTVGGRTRIDLPAGQIGVLPGETVTLRASAPGEKRATISVTNGRILVNHGDLGVVIQAGQSVDFEADPVERSRLRFRVAPSSPGRVIIVRRPAPAPGLQYRLVVPPGAGGVIEPADDGSGTRVLSSPDSPAPMELRRIRDGELEETTPVPPGTTATS